MRLDVVVVSHESSKHLARALRDLPANASVVVVDNASTDHSAEAARELGATVIENDFNAGFAAAANQGAALGSSEAILFLNPDASIGASDLERLLDALKRDEALAGVSPQVRYADGTEQRIRWPFPSSRRAWREALGLARRPKPDVGFVIGACFLVRRRAFEQLGAFDTRYWLYGEETDLCWRALEAGWRVEVATDSEAMHEGGASGDAEPTLVREHFERGGERFVLDHEAKRGLVSYRLANLLGSAVRAIAPGPQGRRDLHLGRFRRAASQLVRAPTTVPLASPATRSAARSVVVCSLEDWDDTWRRNQFLVRELLDVDLTLRVLFVEPPCDWLHQLVRLDRSARRRGLRSVRPDGRVLAFQPAKAVPRALGSFADGSIDRQVRQAVVKLGFTEPTLWINDPARASLVSSTGWPSLYDVTDDWLEADRPKRVARRTSANERELLERADAVVVCSPDLAQRRRPLRPDLVLIPNAVDGEHFSSPRERPPDLPSGRLGVYVGTLHEDRLDVDLIVRVAADLPELTIVLVGPNLLTASNQERLSTWRNVVTLGARPYGDVPAYLQHADVVLIPHVVTPFTESLDPIKAYECLAVGRPTVSTPVAGFRDLGGCIRAVAPDQFAAEIEYLLAGQQESVPRPTPTWAERGREFATVLASARSGRRVSRNTSEPTGCT